MSRQAVIQALGYAALLLGDYRLSAEAMHAIAAELESLGVTPEDATTAIKRAAALGRGLSLPLILAHLPGGHPSAEEAWVIIHEQEPQAVPELALQAWRFAKTAPGGERAQWAAFVARYNSLVATAVASGTAYARYVEPKAKARRHREQALPPEVARTILHDLAQTLFKRPPAASA